MNADGRTDRPCVVILGATSGIARAIGRALGQRGFDLVLAARDTEENAALAADVALRTGCRAWAVALDAGDDEGHDAFVARCVELAGERLEGVVACLGNMPPQEQAQADWRTARSIVDVNFTAGVVLLERFAAILEQRRAGWICGVSSVAGDRGRMSNYIYGSAKAGFSTYLAGLRNRLWHSGVHVVTVKPGPVDTAMTYGLDKLPFLAQPDAVGERVVRGILKRRDVIYAPGIWRWIMLVIRYVPEWKFKRLKM